MKTVILIISMLIGLFSMAQKSANLLETALIEQANDFPKSKVFLKTDKDIYASGEKIWFKAEIFNCLTERASNDKNLIVLIMSEGGEVIADNSYLVHNGLVSDQVTIPSWASEGNVSLIAYTQSALNVNEASLAAVKPLTINCLDKNDYLLNVHIADKIYKAGDDIKINLSINALSASVSEEKLLITLYDYHRVVFSEKVKVNVNEQTNFTYKLPLRIEDGLYFDVETLGKNSVNFRHPVHTEDDPIKVEFYPEGGDLLTNTIQRIVYRATDPFGNPTDVSGVISDPQKNQVGVGKIMKNGFGVISFMPMSNQKYTFKIDSKYGRGQQFTMPEAILHGTALSLVKIEKDLLRLSIHNTGKAVNRTLTVVAVESGQIRLKYELVAKQKNQLKIPSAELPAGLVTFLVLNQKGEIISERMVYNTKIEDSKTEIVTSVDQQQDKGVVEIKIDAQSFVRKYGSSWADIRVIDVQNLYTKTDSRDHGFLKYPLLTASPKTVLDIYLTNLELIANKNRYFSYTDILNGVDYTDMGNEMFSGFVSDKSMRRIPNATVMVNHPAAPSLVSTTTDENGRFEFNNLEKSADMVLKAINKSGKKTYLVHLDRSFDENLEEIMLIESFKKRAIYSVKTTPQYVHDNRNLLKKVGTETKSRKAPKVTTTQQMLMSGSSVLDVVRMIKPFTLYGSKIVFSGTSNSFMRQQGALIVVDGIKMGTSVDALSNVNPHNVVSINVSTDPTDVQKYTGLNTIGVIEIRTKDGSNSIALNRKKTARVSEFNQSNFSKSVWEHQTTLHWEPLVELPENGTYTFMIKTNEIQSEFMIQVDVLSIGGVRQQSINQFSTVK